MKLNFVKMHGLGNDFVIINNLSAKINLSSKQAQLISNRNQGIGCDQILLIEKPKPSSQADFNYHIYNQDGSVAFNCGNGARCVIKYLVDNQLTNKSQIQLQLHDRIINGEALDNGKFKINMGVPQFDQQSNTPLIHNFGPSDKIEYSVVSMGNPHAIIWLDTNPHQASLELLEFSAKQLQNNLAAFPNGVNVSFAQIIDRHTINVKTYERGTGFTLSCGSAACATAVAAINLNIVESIVKITNPLGELDISWLGSNNSVYMTGPATYVFSGEINLCVD